MWHTGSDSTPASSMSTHLPACLPHYLSVHTCLSVCVGLTCKFDSDSAAWWLRGCRRTERQMCRQVWGVQQAVHWCDCTVIEVVDILVDTSFPTVVTGCLLMVSKHVGVIRGCLKDTDGWTERKEDDKLWIHWPNNVPDVWIDEQERK